MSSSPSFLRSERVGAAVLLGAAILGLVLANLSTGPGLLAIKSHHLDIPGIGLNLSVGHWVSDGLLALFFFVVAVDLKHELLRGQLNSVKKAIVPGIAAIGGVIMPAVVFAIVTIGSGYGSGWPIPTATDIAFALGVLAVFGSHLPGRIRVFLLALAVLDDLVAILIIAVFFTHGSNLAFLGFGVVAVAATFGAGRLLGRRKGAAGALLVVLVIVLAVVSWYFVYRSGVHATIAAVAVGLVLPLDPARKAVHALEPFVNGLVLPIFAFAAAAVAVPSVGLGQLSPVFWAIVIALPVGKLIGITLAGGIASRVFRDPDPTRRSQTLSMFELVTVAMLGGIGFTVSLLMNELAFKRQPEIVDEGTLAVLIGSGISIVIAAVLVTLLKRAETRANAAKRAAVGQPR
ncbi:sodium:proton antiporter [Frondihabitans sp. PAMC 28766]|uniref:Na+/H+ antiporter NhaA n=1 Tax=Frondihabitans sp. PAMC 28766 TaxID=1795630 RepID=UPI00078D6EBC|nr:Na+/H+ antiporter NhaA [Frondihabitans sp. PAMC 28766]AMM20222.1 sodium:proton antiporter [Frondihabitans sp. PAMC 28766]